jgi:hypothetical protein
MSASTAPRDQSDLAQFWSKLVSWTVAPLPDLVIMTTS